MSAVSSAVVVFNVSSESHKMKILPIKVNVVNNQIHKTFDDGKSTNDP